MKQLVFVVILLVAVMGCARKQGVIVDTRGIDLQLYQQDLYECQQYAQQVESKAGSGAVGGALVGGAIGAVIGGRHSVQKGAGVGAISGLARGGAMTRREKQQVVKNCLRGRGYSVLN
jgi:uncharacterized protein YcfJ